MSIVRSVDFLPEIFQTDANRQFLAATLDQLIQEPKFRKTQGFIGRTVGPGVNPSDQYVVEPNKTRADYQLEPGVVSLEPDTDRVRDVITYPGINDAVEFQGGNAGRPDRLYNSDYYSWDPFVDFDSFVNFSQYFWIPNGPDVVDVAAVGVPFQANFSVTRENGVYTFGSTTGSNPTIELVRGGSYTFQVAQNAKETVNYRVRNIGTAAYTIDTLTNPTLTLARGNTYVFNLNLTGAFPFWIKSEPTTGTENTYNSGVTRNGSNSGLVTFVVPEDAPDLLYYASENQANMRGQLTIVDSVPGTGPGFWIQTAPGVAGTLPATPNVSSRDVFGVANNGQDLGTVIFNVPYKTSQSFYYNLNSINNVDLITELRFDQINNRSVAEFVAQYGGIDGITNLNGRTLIFTNPNLIAPGVGSVDGGWVRTTLFDPLPNDPANNGQPGSYDNLPYDETTEIPQNQRTQLWQISYVNNAGANYIQLSKIQDIAAQTKFTIRYGTEYSSTQWYKDDTELFSRIPLLTAAQDILYYQDGTDPGIVGIIKLIDQSNADTLDVDDIIGKSLYTSPNGVTFSNGLKVRFTGEVTPESYGSSLGILNYSATESGTNYITAVTDTANLYVNQQIVFSAPTLGGLVPGATYYVRSFAANGLKFTVSATPGGPAVALETGRDAFPNIATTIGNREYYVSGVGAAIELLPVPDFVVPESYAVDSFSNVVAQTFVITTVPDPAGPGAIYQVDGVNKPVLNFVRGGVYTFDQSAASNTNHPIAFRDSTGASYTTGVVTTGVPGQPGARTVITVAADAPDSLRYYCTVHGNNMGNTITVSNSAVSVQRPDYITISRASGDLNAWSRSNRWFHIDVITATAEYNNTPVTLDNSARAKRPVIQFRPGIRLYNMGTQGKQPVDVIDFTETDAFSNIVGSTGYTIDGYALVEGSRVIFATDTDADVRNKVYQVSFVIPDSVPPLIDQPIINLTPATDGTVSADQSVVVLAGTDTSGKTYWFDGIVWALAQQKTNVQQAPLYDIYDSAGVSFGNNTKYPSTTFAGSKLFSYAAGDTNILDPVLQFPLQYLNINNVGDIVFDNNLYKDAFLYVEDNASVTLSLNTGSVQEYQTRTDFKKLIGWQTAAATSQVYQQFKFNYVGPTVTLDVAVTPPTASAVPVIKVYVGSVFQDTSAYSYKTTANSTTITLNKIYGVNDVIEVLVLSDQTSNVAFYQVPVNLESNPLNENSESFTLGTIRSHYQSICENVSGLKGAINGANNTRDLGNVVPFGLIILQQSAPLTLAGYFLRSEEYNIFSALQYNNKEYVKFKAQMLDTVLNQNIGFRTTAQVLDTAIQDVTMGKVDSQPFYWSDMIPAGVTMASNSYTVGVITGNSFDTVQVYNYTSANYFGLLVYKNSQLLTRGVDYVVATDGPRITVTAPIVPGDTVTINEYASTYGSFLPNTPTKLGLYPSYLPGIILQRSSTGPVRAIRGHDGSTTPLFGDIRDDVLLEFETRIYNNLKLDGNPVPLEINDVMPGQFRKTGYTFQEINNILSQDFLSYCGWNKLDFKVQNYQADNSFTWNYSSAQNKLDSQNMLGAWRGIYRYTYDTQQPDSAPWEMLGLNVRPTWWNERYGPAPYTRDNLVLWDDIAAGYVADPAEPYFAKGYARPGLLNVLPTDTEGELLSPAQSVMGTFDEQKFQKSWVVGDGGPVEASWWNSSSYPFAVMRVLALTRPAQFFALFADRDLYRYNNEYQQYLYNNRFRLDANGIEVYGNGVSKASYVNWIVDYNRLTGLDSARNLTADLKSLDVRLCYRMASFSDKQYIKLYTEKSSPNSQNTALLIPDESYNILLYKNQPFDRLTYSSVTIQRTSSGGFAVDGYSTVQPYFNILESQAAGRLQTYSNGGITVRVPTFYTNTVVQVPYGFVFDSATSVADFLLSYGKFLERQGLSFTEIANGYVLDWPRMVNEFLYWSQQGWDTDAIINLNPLAAGLTVTKPQAIVNSVRTQTAENAVLTQNSQEFPVRNLNIVRLNNTFTMQSLDSNAISFAELSYTNYEHMIVLNNKSVFGDLIYAPVTGARQSRLNITAMTSTNWNGSVDAPGFILNQDNVEEWAQSQTYSKGEIVRYKNLYWSALTIVQPSTAFNFNNWTQSDYVQTEFGLLPNLSNKADQLTNSYNINTANIDSDTDLFSYGLIGFRPRQYMAALNLDDVSQVNLYQQFIGSKGTALSAELFKGANFGKEFADYDIFENWAVQRAVYGANANRSFFELRLDRALLNANPSLIQVVVPQQSSKADQTVLLSDVWRQSYRLTSPDILSTTATLSVDTALPTAGYVNLDDVDITVFDIDVADSLSENIDLIKTDSKLWVAKVNDYDWNIYRVQSVPGTLNHVCDNLNGTSRAIFSKQHNLVIGDKLIIKFFDQEVDGVYQVIGVPDPNTVNIVFQFGGDRTVANGQGLGFTLKSMRVAQASDIAELPYANEIGSGAKVWVDNTGAGSWAVLEKQQVFGEVQTLTPDLDVVQQNENFGASLAQARNKLAILVGSPGYAAPGNSSSARPGGVYVYVNSFSDVYTPVSPLGSEAAVLTLDVDGARGYGNAVDFGNQIWAVAGASASLGPNNELNNGYAAVIFQDPVLAQPGAIPFAQWQLLTQPGTTPTTTPGAGEFGRSVVMSQDERWMYIGAPGLNQVHAYGRVDWQNQFVRARGDAVTDVYNISGAIQIDQTTQLRVAVDGLVLTLNTDYTVNSELTEVTFVSAPAMDVLIDIQRIFVQQIDARTYFNIPQTSTAGKVREVTVTNDGKDYIEGNTTVTFSAPQVAGGVTATGTVTLSDGNVTSVTVDQAGSGYNEGNTTVTFSAPQVAGGITATGTVTLSGGNVTSVTVDQAGSGYNEGNTTVTFSAPQVAGGITATGTVTIVADEITGIAVNEAGSGYTSAPVVTITDTNETPGTGAEATAVISGSSVTGIAVNEAGSGYTSAPVVTITDTNETPGTGAEATAVIGSSVTGIVLTNAGSGYTSAPVVTITGDGTDATAIATAAAGTGVEFTIVRVRNDVGQPGATLGSTIGATSFGSGYVVTDTITIAAASFDGGVDGVNDAVLTVTSVGAGGSVSSFNIAYTPPALQTVFDLGANFFTATGIDSFSVTVDSVLYRPNIDYTFDNTAQELTFVTVPPAGTVIVVNAQEYFEYVTTITTGGLTAGARFGQSVSCTTDGRQVMIGAPNQTVDGQVQAGTVYVFDRNVQKFIYNSDSSSNSISVRGPVTEPVAVYVNNTRLTNAAQEIDNASGTFVVNEPVSGQFEVIIEDPLNTGDVVEIETNQFALLQMIEQNAVAEFSNFGAAVDLCLFNCSLYVGGPQSSVQIYKGGIVERNVNQSRTYGSITSLNTYQHVQDPLADYSTSFVPGMYKDNGKSLTTDRTQYLFVGALTTGHTLRVNNIDVAVPAAPNNTIIGLRDAINATVPNVLATVSGVESGYLILSVKNNAAAAEGDKLQVAPGTVGTAFADLGFNTFAWTQNITNPYPVAFAGFGSSVNIDTSAVNLVVGAPQGTLYFEIEFDQATTIFDIGSTVFFSDIVQSGAVYTFDFLPSSSQTLSNPGKFVFGAQLYANNVGTYADFGSAVNYTSGVLVIGSPAADIGGSSGTDYGSVFVYENATRAPVWQATTVQQPVVDIRLLNSVFLYDQSTSATTEFLDFIDPLQGKILGAARQNIDYIGAIDPASYNAGATNVRGTTWAESRLGQVWWNTSTVRFIDPNQDDIVYASRRWSQVFPGSSVDVYQWIKSDVPPANYAGEGIVFDASRYTVNSKLSFDGNIITDYYFWVRGITVTASNLRKTLPISTVASYIENPRASGIAYMAAVNASTVALYNAGDLVEASNTVLHVEFDRELTTDNVHVEYELIAQGRADGFLSNNLYRKLQDSFCGVDTSGNQVPDSGLSPAEQYGVQFRPRQSMFVDRFDALRNYLTRANAVLKQHTIAESRMFTLLNSNEPELPQTQQANGNTLVNWNMRLANLEILGFQNIESDSVPLGYKYLVQADSNNRGLWTIYTVQNNQINTGVRELVLTRVQNFNTTDYWNYIDWYRPGYNISSKITTEVASFSQLDTLAVPAGFSAKVTANARGKFEIYLRTDTGWERVGLEDGTIEFSSDLWNYAQGRFGFDLEVFDAQYYDQEPVIETRKIIQAINQELFIDDLAIERNRALTLMFDYVLSEFSAPEWLVKTSLIDVDHRIRDLIPYQNFIRDNQEFVEDYIQEVKPYHVQIREFNLKYAGFDNFFGDVADFDLPALFNTTLEVPKYTSPALLPYERGTAFNSQLTTNSDVTESNTIWTTWPYSTWYQNYLLTVVDIRITNAGTAYNEPPTVTFVGPAVQPAQGRATINSVGQVTGVVITTPGLGYRAIPTVVFSGGNGINATAYAVMGSAAAQDYSDSVVSADAVLYSPVRTFRTTMKFDRCQYVPSLFEWDPDGTYQSGDLVRYDNRVWQAASTDSAPLVTGPTFDLENWDLVNAGTYNEGRGLSGVDRTMGLYVSGVNSPGLDLPLLIDGVDYPGVQVYGDYFLRDPRALDAIYQSKFSDTTLGNRFSDVNVNGGEFVGLYEGHAPEELVNGSEFDTLDFKVFTRPGSDWSDDGHGFKIGTVRYTHEPGIVENYSWAGVIESPVQILVSNITTGIDLNQDIDFSIDWSSQTVTIISKATSGDIINIGVYSAGGGSQLYRTNYIGVDVGQTVVIPVNTAEIYDVAVFVNGSLIETVSWIPYAQASVWDIVNLYQRLDVVEDTGTYYRALQTVPPGIDIANSEYWLEFVPTLETLVNFGQTFNFGDGVSLLALGVTTPEQYSWSSPQVQIVVADTALVISKSIAAVNSLEGTNIANMIVTRNGIRLRPAEGIEWFGDDSSVSFGLPQRGGYQQDIIDPVTDVLVWVDDVLQTQSLGAFVGDFSVTNWDGSNTPGRQVVFAVPPAAGLKILISVNTVADYIVAGNQIQMSTLVNPGDVFAITTWNDTAQQNILTQVFVGPVVSGIVINEPYDSTAYDPAVVNNTPGSYDYTSGTSVANNQFDLQREDIVASRLLVTLSGLRLFEGIDYTVENGFLILATGAVGPAQVVVVTQFTNSVTPEEMAFRIFQDMRGVQATYRITRATTTQVRSAATADADEILVLDAAALGEPTPDLGIFGVVMIDGERIMYRERDLSSNTISSLIRGTAGTAAAAHAVGSDITDLSRGNLLVSEYQNYVVSDTTLSDGSTSVFYAPSITNFDFGDSSTIFIESLEVYVGGTRQYAYSETAVASQYPWIVTDFDPVAIEFLTDTDPVTPMLLPPAGLEVTILVRRGKLLYTPGENSASNGVALQDTENEAARFLRGL